MPFGRPPVGRRGVPRAVSAIAVVLIVSAALAVAAFRSFSGASPSDFDLSAALSRMDGLISDPERFGEAVALAEAAAAAVRSQGAGVESALSVLKRLRTPARLRPSEYSGAYLRAAIAAAGDFPHAPQLAAAVADAALLMPAEDEAALAALRRFAPRLGTEAAEGAPFELLRAAAAIRLGETAVPSAALPPRTLAALSDAYRSSDPEAAEALAVDAAASVLLGGDDLAARTVARDRLADLDALSPRALRFLAELEYDFGEPLQAAALFSRLEGAESALRRADSAVLAGDLGQARTAWLSALDAPASEPFAGPALYNLALHAEDAAAARSYARRLAAAFPSFESGLVLYARLSGDPSVLAAAEGGDGTAALELIRFESAALGVGRTTARIWLLLNAKPDLETAAEWGAWYAWTSGETEEALRMARSRAAAAVDAPSWTKLYEGFAAARAGRLEDAERAFDAAAARGGDWTLAANTALLAEARRDVSAALKRCEIAASLDPPPAAAAELQLRISRLLRALGRDADALRALEYGLDLDPDNRQIRLELRKTR